MPAATHRTERALSTAIRQAAESGTAEGERRSVTIVFADISGFTRLSETLDPEDVVALMNRCLGDLAAIVDRYEGTVDKFIGDSVMAVFGAPLPQADHALRAVRAALSMHRSLDELNRGLTERGQPRIEFGIGINSAAVVVGNMGSTRRLNYTVIGDGVNIAARVEKLTREYDVPILVTASTQAEAPGFLFREIDRVRVRGRDDIQVAEAARPQIGRDHVLADIHVWTPHFSVGKNASAVDQHRASLGKDHQQAVPLAHVDRGEFQLIRRVRRRPGLPEQNRE